MKLTDLTTKQRIGLASLGFFALLGLVIFLVAAPLIRQIRNDGLELSAKKKGIELLYQDWRVLESSRKEYLKIEGELNSLPTILPPGEALKFIMLIENIAQSTNNQQEVSVISSNTKEKNDQPIDFQITLRGDFSNLIKFIAYLENAPYYNEINSVQIKGLSDKDIQSIKEGERTDLAAGDITSTLKISVHQ
jgi:hypothetical protein